MLQFAKINSKAMIDIKIFDDFHSDYIAVMVIYTVPIVMIIKPLSNIQTP